VTKKKKRRPGQTPGRRPAGSHSGQTQPLRTRREPSRPKTGEDVAPEEGSDVATEMAAEGEPLAPTKGPAALPGPRGRAALGRGGASGTRGGSSRTRTASSGARTGTARRQSNAPPGLFGFLRAESPYPRLGATLGRGIRAVLEVPILVVLPLLVALAMWLGLVAAGLDHVPQGMADLLSLPPISSFFDLNIVFNIVGLSTATILSTLGLTVVRSVVWAVLVGLVVESLETGRASMDGARRGVRAIPSVLGILLTNLAIIFGSQILRLVLGASFGSLALLGGLVGGMYFLAFAPVIAVRAGLSARQSMAKSARAGRLPGASHLGLVFLYFFLSFYVLLFLGSGGAFTANPSLALWSFVLVGTIVHLIFLAGFAYRYAVVEDEIPPPVQREARPRRRLF
jgi:hypothetical protein